MSDRSTENAPKALSATIAEFLDEVQPSTEQRTPYPEPFWNAQRFEAESDKDYCSRQLELGKQDLERIRQLRSHGGTKEAAMAANAIINADREALIDMIHAPFEVEFKIGDDFMRLKDHEFMNWICDRVEEFPATEKLWWTFDVCGLCQEGKPILLFNDGSFPLRPTHNWDKMRSGILFKFEGSGIVDVRMCAGTRFKKSYWLQDWFDKETQALADRNGLNLEEAEKAFKDSEQYAFWSKGFGEQG